MRILIAEDDYVSRKFLYKFLCRYGDCDVTVDGVEAIDVFLMALDEGRPYDLVCLDIMMPELDGIQVLKTIRKLEIERDIKEELRTKVIMTTALSHTDQVLESFDSGSEGYAVKPIDTDKLVKVLEKLKLV